MKNSKANENPEKKVILNSFKEYTGIMDENLAKYMLDSAEWNFDVKITRKQLITFKMRRQALRYITNHYMITFPEYMKRKKIVDSNKISLCQIKNWNLLIIIHKICIGTIIIL